MDDRTRAEPIEILLVEDNPGDARLAQEALRDSKILNNLHLVKDGVEAMEFLRCQGRYRAAVRPDIILLDLNMPKKDGREVLAELKEDEDLRRIPVVIMTTSSAETDVINAYDLHANCFITKPIDLDQFMAIVQQIESFWLNVVRLPPK